MKHMKKPLSILLTICMIVGLIPWTTMPALAESDLTISTEEDWNTFATAVSNGTTYSGQTVTLGADITVSTMAGASANKFKGTFYGNGHTLTFDATATAEGCAPFFAIDGATFKCLNVGGAISTDKKLAAGIAAHTYGDCTIQNCRSSVAITTSVSDDGTHAGFIAIQESGTLNITNCLFDGSITGSRTTNCGGFVGWRNGTLTFNNCFQNGTLSLQQTSGSATFNRNNSSSTTLNNCYYKTAYGDVQGTQTSATGSELQPLLGSGWQVSDSSVVPIMDANDLGIAAVSGVDSYYVRTGDEIKPEPTVTAADGTTLTKDTHYTVTWSGDGTTEGNYTLTVAGLSPYSGSQTLNYTVKSADMTISSVEEWNQFAENVNSGTDYQGKYVKLVADVGEISTMVGTNDHRFKGTFDGNGKTLNVNINDTSNQGAAPFRYISDGAVIKNLTVTGSVTGTTHAAGLVGFSVGGTDASPNTIEGCTVSASVTVNAGGNMHMGGVVGHGLESYLKIKDTVFDGAMTNGGNFAGGLQGWSDGNHLTIENCLFKGSYSGSGSFHPIAIHTSGKTTTATVSGAYYTAAPTLTDSNSIAAQGTRVYASAPTGGEANPVTAADGNTYYEVTDWQAVTSIATASDWDTFANSLNEGVDYSGKTVTLANDITVSTMVGTSAHKFNGTFNGDGHTLTLNLTNDGDECTAPFRYVDGAAIKLLHTAGAVNGNSRKCASGLIGSAEGNVTITACRSSVAISSNVSGDGTHGGFIGGSGTSVTFTNCLFDGSITGASTSNCAGFVGWRGNAMTFNNCLMAGTLNISLDGNSAIFNRNTGATLTNCYYTGSYGSAEAQGTQTSATGDALRTLLGSGWKVSGSDVVPIMDANDLGTATVSGVDSYYIRTGNEIKPEPTVTAANGAVLTKNTDYTVEWSGDGRTDGAYTVTVTGKGNYTGSQSVSYVGRVPKSKKMSE